MRDLLRDYQHLRSLEPQQVAAWVQEEFPVGVNSRWCFAMYDNALTDSFSVNDGSPDDVRRRVDLAITLIRLAEERREVPTVTIIKWYLRCARKAAEAGITPVPAAVTADAVVRQALEFFTLSPAQAVRIAESQREELIDAMRTTPAEDDVIVPGNASYRQLAHITMLLADLAWFSRKVGDDGLAGQLQAWLDLREQFRPGPVVAQRSSARMRARMRGD